MSQRHQSASTVLASIREKLASARSAKPEEILDAFVAALAESRGYAWIGIYLAVENLGVRQASVGRGPAPQSMSLDDLKAEIAVPIRLGARTLGLIVAETGKASGQARQERVLLQQTAKLIAQYLTTDRAKQLLRKTRDKARAGAAHPNPRKSGAGWEPRAAEVQPHKSPQSSRPVVRRAAAGERIPR